MTIRKIFAAALAASMMLALAACGGESSTAELSSSAGETTTSSSAATTEKTETTTTARVTTTAASSAEEITTTTVTTTEPAVSQTEMTMSTAQTESTDNCERPDQTEYRMIALARKIQTTKDAVLIHVSTEQNGMKLDVSATTYGERFYMEMEYAGKFVIKACSDGKKQYLINDKTRNYALSKDDSTENPQDSFTEEALGTFVGSGTEKFKTKTCFYEDFDSVDDDGEEQRTRYYFDGDSLVGTKVLKGSDAGEVADFTIKFHSSVDVSLFSPPKGYEEVDEDEMGLQLLELLLGAVQ